MATTRFAETVEDPKAGIHALSGSRKKKKAKEYATVQFGKYTSLETVIFTAVKTSALASDNTVCKRELSIVSLRSE
jgi:hypothetical protein